MGNFSLFLMTMRSWGSALPGILRGFLELLRNGTGLAKKPSTLAAYRMELPSQKEDNIRDVQICW
jgi:hypothetical protein